MIKPLRRIEQTRGDVIWLKVGIVLEDLLTRFSTGKQFENINDANTLPANASAAAALLGSNRDSLKKL